MEFFTFPFLAPLFLVRFSKGLSDFEGLQMASKTLLGIFKFPIKTLNMIHYVQGGLSPFLEKYIFGHISAKKDDIKNLEQRF